jgi:hypothetical protein
MYINETYDQSLFLDMVKNPTERLTNHLVRGAVLSNTHIR